MLVMYNRYHNFAATQLKRINENGRFSIPAKFDKPTKWSAVAASPKGVFDEQDLTQIKKGVEEWEATWSQWEKQGQKPVEKVEGKELNIEAYEAAETRIRDLIYEKGNSSAIDLFVQSYEAAWDKLDDDLFNTARL